MAHSPFHVFFNGATPLVDWHWVIGIMRDYMSIVVVVVVVVGAAGKRGCDLFRHAFDHLRTTRYHFRPTRPLLQSAQTALLSS
jgi:hypothetical protein